MTRPGVPAYVDFWEPRRANCIVWAFVQQFRWGGWVCWRKSRYGWWPHAIWSIDRKLWWEYLPTGFSGRLRWWQVLWIVLFRGEPRMVDRDEL